MKGVVVVIGKPRLVRNRVKKELMKGNLSEQLIKRCVRGWEGPACQGPRQGCASYVMVSDLFRSACIPDK